MLDGPPYCRVCLHRYLSRLNGQVAVEALSLKLTSLEGAVMTVAELIAKLNEFDPRAVVLTPFGFTGFDAVQSITQVSASLCKPSARHTEWGNYELSTNVKSSKEQILAVILSTK